MLKHIQTNSNNNNNNHNISTASSNGGLHNVSIGSIDRRRLNGSAVMNGSVVGMDVSLNSHHPAQQTSALAVNRSLVTSARGGVTGTGVGGSLLNGAATVIPKLNSSVSGSSGGTRTTALDQSRDPPSSADVSALTALNASVSSPPPPPSQRQQQQPPHASVISTHPALTYGARLCGRVQCASAALPRDAAVRRMLLCLAVLCVSALLLAILAAIFLLKVTPLDVTHAMPEQVGGLRRATVSARQYLRLYEVTVALTALSVCLNLCCVLVCSTQLVLCVRLVKTDTSIGGEGGTTIDDSRSGAYLQRSSPSRIFAMVGYFLSIPVFLTGVVLYTFLHFHSTSAVATSVFLGLGILFCAAATAHNIGVWQRVRRESIHHYSSAGTRDKYTSTPQHNRQLTLTPHHRSKTKAAVTSDLPSPTLDLSGGVSVHHPHSHHSLHHLNVSNIHELSTLV